MFCSTSSMQPVRVMLTTLAAWLFVTLAGCAPGVGSSGTGYANGSQSGTVTGYGSIIVESNRYDDTNATVTIEDGPDLSRALSIDDVALGMQVLVDFDQNDAATRIHITPQLVGPVDAVSATGLIVAGQAVIVSNGGLRPTVREGFEALGELSGQQVTAYGQYTADGGLLATRVESRPVADNTTRRVTGVVSSVTSATATTTELTVGNLVIRVPSQNVLPAGVVPVAGDTITAFADSAAQSGVLDASGAVIRGASRLTGEAIRIASIIRRIDPDGTLVVGAVRVDASAAQVITSAGSTSTDNLATGMLVRVTGQRNGETLVADRITLVSGQGEPITVRGLIDDFFAADSFRVRGVLIDASMASLTGGAGNNLVDNVAVAVSGQLVDGRLEAQSVQFLFSRFSGEQTLFDTVSAYNATTGELALLGQTVSVSAGTTVTSLAGATLDLSALENGSRVIARGSFINDVFAVNRLILLNPGDTPLRQTSGIAYAVDTTAQRLRVGRVAVQWDAQTTFVGDPNDLGRGSRVRVIGRAIAGGLLADRIEIR